MEEVLKHLEKQTVILLPVLHFRRLRAVAALDVACARRVRFGGLGALLHVHKPCGRDQEWDLEFWFKRKQVFRNVHPASAPTQLLLIQGLYSHYLQRVV